MKQAYNAGSRPDLYFYRDSKGVEDGRTGGDRTRDPNIKSVVLYQLSYSPPWVVKTAAIIQQLSGKIKGSQLISAPNHAIITAYSFGETTWKTCRAC